MSNDLEFENNETKEVSESSIQELSKKRTGQAPFGDRLRV